MQAAIKNSQIPRPAATVILTRAHADEFQVYLLKRSDRSGFMGGYYVFPGGTLDTEDRDTGVWRHHVDMNFEDISIKLGGGLNPEDALAYGVAALRETMEEAGVLLARQEQPQAGGQELICSLRLRPNFLPGWFKQRIVMDKWILALSRLTRWAHWITPELMKRRYDTRFFLTFLPAEQVCRPDNRETTHGLWISPREGLAANRNGKIPLSPPTLITLSELSKYPHWEDLQNEAEHRTWGETMLPRLIPLKAGAVILEPWDPQYRQKNVNIDVERLEQSVLPIGEPFSRIWCHEGIWRAIAVS